MTKPFFKLVLAEGEEDAEIRAYLDSIASKLLEIPWVAEEQKDYESYIDLIKHNNLNKG